MIKKYLGIKGFALNHEVSSHKIEALVKATKETDSLDGYP